MEVTLPSGRRIRKVIRTVDKSELHPSINWSDKPVTILLANHGRGHSFKTSRHVTVPEWSTLKIHGDHYLSYYVCHEIAHIESSDRGHGTEFYEAFKQICPKELQHYELNYKPRNASKSGITRLGVINR